MLAAPTDAQQRFRVTDLGAPPGGISAKAHGINAPGAVVGEFVHEDAQQNQSTRAFIWLPEADFSLPAGMTDLSELAGATDGYGVAYQINDNGVVVGSSGTTAGTQIAFVWDLAARAADPQSNWAQPLGTMGGDRSAAFAVSNHSPPVIVGRADNGDMCPNQAAYFEAFRVQWSITGPNTLIQLDPQTVGLSSEALDVNDVGIGVVVGFSEVCTGLSTNCDVRKESLAWQTANSPPASNPPVNMQAIMDTTDDWRAQTRGINNAGNAVGFGAEELPGGFCRPRALYWSSVAANYLDLHLATSISENQDTIAEAINDGGLNGKLQVVGRNNTLEQARLWERDAQSNWTVFDLNADTTCFTVRFANDINDKTEIVGSGVQDQSIKALLLQEIGDCPADLNGDNAIDVFDLFIMLDEWGPCTPGEVCAADMNEGFLNCQVDVFDLYVLLAAWGTCGQPTGPVPQSAEDCYDKFHDDPEALEQCLWALEFI